MTTTRHESVSAHDGGTFEAFCAVPDSGRGPGVLLFQEIFGINDNMRGLAEKPMMRLERYDAGHAFSNWDAPSMYQAKAAELAWSRTLDFFATHLR